MAATTPVLFGPPDAATDVPLTGIVQFSKDAYSGAGSQSEWQIQIATEATFTDVVYDSLLRAADNLWVMVQVIDVPVEMIPLLPSTVYYWRGRVRNTSAETSSWATTRSFTTAAARVTSARSREAE